MSADIPIPPTQFTWVPQLVSSILAAFKQVRGEYDEYTVATLPDPATERRVIAVTDETGGYTIAFSDGSDWRRVQDRAVVS